MLEEGPTEEVWLVACGTLASCPLSAVPDSRGKPLGQRFAVRELVSAAAPAAKPVRRGTAVAIIDPSGDLHFARAEREALARWADRVVEPPEGRPTDRWLLEALAEARLAHLACHGQLDPEDPMRSRFDLGHQRELSVGDLSELATPQLELVVAPACQSGSANPDAPDELLGVGHALAHAGARMVIASLWDADDAATALVVARLYFEMAAGQVPSRALHRAQQWIAQLSGPELRKLADKRLAGSGDAAWLPYDLAVEFSALSAHPRYRSGEVPVFAHPVHWAALSCLEG